MAKLAWDETGKRFYETGVDRGVLFVQDTSGTYTSGIAWNGLTSVTESPTGAEITPQYADNVKYLNLTSVEEFGATIEAYTYPEQFGVCDGTASPSDGLLLGQQARRRFGFAYRTRLGNDLVGTDLGYKLHIIYGAYAAPSEKAYATVNDSPEALTFSWEITTNAVDVTGYKPTASLTIDSTKLTSTKLTELENILYGTVGVDARLPLPDEIVTLLGASNTEVTPTVPTYTSGTHTIAIPTVTGVTYKIGNVVKTGNVVLTSGQSVVVTAYPNAGYKFPLVTDNDWLFTY
jgi:hypothetical protein